MKVKIIYRNYIPLYPQYFSFDYSPIPDITVSYDAPNLYLRKLYSIYNSIRDNSFIRPLLPLAQKTLFNTKTDSSIDLELYVGMIPDSNPTKPYLVDLEHINALFNFSEPSSDYKKHIFSRLQHKLCKGILPWSNAAKHTLQKAFGAAYDEISDKVQVVYPALPAFLKASKEYFNQNRPLKLLFIGKDCFRKGLQEVLDAFEALQKQIPLELTIISNTPRAFIEKYKSNPKINFHNPNFSFQELQNIFYSTHDIFIMPTLADSFGLVLLEAMSAGLAVITTRQFATPEIIINSKTGILLDHDPLPWCKDSLSPLSSSQWQPPHETREQIIHSIKQQIMQVYFDKDSIYNLSSQAASQFNSKENFSISKRNEILSKIFYNSCC